MINMEKILEDIEMAKEKGQEAGTTDPSDNKINLDKYLSEYDVPVKKKERQNKKTLYILEHCLFDQSHTGKDAAIIQHDDGRLGYHCFHDSCSDKHWKDARRIISGDDPLSPNANHIELNGHEGESLNPAWEYVKGTFPYQSDFPWGIFPPAIADSLRACAESCATSSTSLAGTAFAILASPLGRMVLVSPKAGWEEPLLVWTSDIRESGEGKTPGMNLLARPLHHAQLKSDQDFEREKELWEQTPKKDRGPEPKWSRSYFASALTLEGLRTALQEGLGGLVCTFNELSAFITSQGQYKGGKGDDREAWLVIFDGKPTRVLRAGKSLTIPESSVSIVGGIQPEVFKAVFSDKNGLYLTDGTIFRFLLTYEPSRNFELTRFTWSEQHRAAWEGLVNKALKWADTRFESGDGPLTLRFSDSAWDCFADFRNRTFAARDSFPPAFRGFIPKAASYVLRIAGLLHVMEQLSNGEDISPVVDLEIVRMAITAVSFYLGHILEALRLLNGEQTSIQQRDDEKYIISALENLSGKAARQGYITVQNIANSYNASTGGAVNARKMGDILLKNGLPTVDVPGHCRGVFLSEIRNFLDRHPRHPQSAAYQDITSWTSEKRHPRHPCNDNSSKDIGDIPKATSPAECLDNSGVRDIRDIRDIVSKQTKKNQPTTPDLDVDLREVIL